MTSLDTDGQQKENEVPFPVNPGITNVTEWFLLRYETNSKLSSNGISKT